MQAAADSLVLDHLGLVTRTARTLKRRVPRSVEVDDLIGAGSLGLVEAAARYQPCPVPFAAYAYRRIRGAMQDFLRDLDWAPRSVRQQQRQEGAYAAAMLPLEDSHLNLPDGAESPLARLERQERPEPVAHAERRARLAAAMNSLPKRERSIVVLYVLHNMPQAEIGAALGITEAYVSKLRTTALTRLRAALSGITV